MLGAVVGSALMLAGDRAAWPSRIGVGGGPVWLEEFAPRNRLITALIEVNINNLAAVPSIVYGLLGLALFINWMHLPRAQSPLVGGSGAGAYGPADHHHRHPVVAQAAVPPSIREAALAMGASKVQTVVPARPASGHARGHDRGHYLHGPCPRRDRAAVADRHGQLHARACPHPSVSRAGRSPAVADLHLGERLRAGVPRADRRRDPGPARLHDRHERRRHRAAPALRTPVVVANEVPHPLSRQTATPNRGRRPEPDHARDAGQRPSRTTLRLLGPTKIAARDVSVFYGGKQALYEVSPWTSLTRR